MASTHQTPQETRVFSNLDKFFWRPPADPDKPALPYVPGFSIQICRHAPPPAYATAQELDELGHQDRTPLKGDDLYDVVQSEAVALNPAVQGVPPTQTGTAQLIVTSPIAIGAVRGAQIVACTIIPEDGHQFKACAKIYDPLYYNFQSTIGRCPQDCVFEADEDYVVEAWAYNFLEQKTDQAGSFSPKFYGSWTFTLPITLKARGELIRRPVRLILLERLEGASIQGSRAQNNPARGSLTDSFHYPEEYRLEVLARAMDGYVKLKQAGIEQADFAGRNILLVMNNEEPGVQPEKIGGLVLPRIVLVDYNQAYMRRDLSPDELETRPVNPAMEFWRNYLFSDIAGWVPGRWSDVKVQQKWLLQRFCGYDRQSLYRPVPQWMLDRFALLHQQGSGLLVSSAYINMADKNLTTVQKAHKVKVAAGAKGNILSAEDRGRTNTRAAGGHVTPTTSLTRSPSSQKVSPGKKTNTTMAATAPGKDAQHLRRSTTPQPSAPGERSSSAEKERSATSPPKVSVGIGKDFWDPNQKPWCKKKAVFKDGKLF